MPKELRQDAFIEATLLSLAERPAKKDTAEAVRRLLRMGVTKETLVKRTGYTDLEISEMLGGTDVAINHPRR